MYILSFVTDIFKIATGSPGDFVTQIWLRSTIRQIARRAKSASVALLSEATFLSDVVFGAGRVPMCRRGWAQFSGGPCRYGEGHRPR